MKSCQGGWCKRREGCANYERRGPNPADRLCVAGKDGTPKPPIVVPVIVQAAKVKEIA